MYYPATSIYGGAMSRKKKPVRPAALPQGMFRNELCAAVAGALLRDFRVNRFSFSGFPSVSAELTTDGVGVSISVGPNTAGPLVLARKRAIAVIKRFRETGDCDEELLRKVQGLVLELEAP